MLRHRLGLCRLFHVECSRALLNHYGNVVPLKNVGFDLVSRRWNGSSVGSGHLEESVQSDERIGDIDIPVSCSGCGVRFQTEDKFKAGYLPPDQAEELKKEQAALLEKANLEGISWRDVAEREFSKLTDQIHRDTMKKKVFREFNEDTVPMEVNDPLLFEENEPIDSNTLLMASLNRNQNRSFVRKKEFPFPASNTAAPELLSYDEYKRLGKGPREIVCSRCYQIKRSNSVSDGMEGIVATDFRPLLVERLCSTGNGTAIVILVMDLLDLHGSFIPDIKNVVKANNPVIIALNKADLFGKGIVLERIRHWAIQEIKAMGLVSELSCLYRREFNRLTISYFSFRLCTRFI